MRLGRGAEVWVVEHHEEGPPGFLADWLGSTELPHRIVQLWKGDQLPDNPEDSAAVVILGSWWSLAKAEPASTRDEVAWISMAMATRVPMLGICFGAQAMAAALGAEVSRAESASVGWLPVDAADREVVSPGPWLHFNYDVFSVPAGARDLGTSPSGPAAFSVGRCLAVQFHPEANVEMADRWAQLDGVELGKRGIERADVTRDAPSDDTSRARAFRFFDAWKQYFLV